MGEFDFLKASIILKASGVKVSGTGSSKTLRHVTDIFNTVQLVTYHIKCPLPF